MTSARSVYAEFGLRALPRLLTLADRNPLSPTYGCFHRDYWLYKTSDFPDAVRQFSVHALALAYAHPLTDPSTGVSNPYYRNLQIRDWAIASLKFWASIQHADGSFDEFYPFERGWVGPTAFTTYAAAEAFRLLRGEVPPEVAQRVTHALRRASRCISEGEREEDRLANHHAMAVLAVATAADVLQDCRLEALVPKLWTGFLRTHHQAEGWSREYDGPDPGYLSATVSFLAKVYKLYREKPPADCPLPLADLRSVLRTSVDFCSYFVFPDGSTAGILGSRNTVHFYPHGFEFLSSEFPLAASIAERMMRSLAEGNLVPPDIMSDRYVHYRVPEFLLAAIDTGKRPPLLPQLPYERPPFSTFFPAAGVAVSAQGPSYTVANLAKGGAVKSYRRDTERLCLNDSGWVGELVDGRVVTSQWMDPAHEISAGERTWRVGGQLHLVPSAKLFRITTHLIFRLALLLLGWHPRAAHWLKGRIRKSLILGRRPVPCRFERTIEFREDHLTITDRLANPSRLQFRRLLLGGEVPVRYVPQSRFFQPSELQSRSEQTSPEDLKRLNAGETLQVTRTVAFSLAPEE